MRLPLNNAVRTSKYGNRKLNGKDNWHPGDDFVSGSGDVRVFAICEGTVVYDFDTYDPKQRWNPSSNSSGGNFVIIRHVIEGVPYFCRYFHLVKNIVSDKQPINEGQMIGEYGDVGLSYGAHLHFDMTTVWGKWGNVDPEKILAGAK